MTSSTMTIVLSVIIGGDVRFAQLRRGVRHIGLRIQDAFVGEGFAQLAGFGIHRAKKATVIDRKDNAASDGRR